MILVQIMLIKLVRMIERMNFFKLLTLLILLTSLVDVSHQYKGRELGNIRGSAKNSPRPVIRPTGGPIKKQSLTPRPVIRPTGGPIKKQSLTPRPFFSQRTASRPAMRNKSVIRPVGKQRATNGVIRFKRLDARSIIKKNGGEHSRFVDRGRFSAKNSSKNHQSPFNSRSNKFSKGNFGSTRFGGRFKSIGEPFKGKSFKGGASFGIRKNSKFMILRGSTLEKINELARQAQLNNGGKKKKKSKGLHKITKGLSKFSKVAAKAAKKLKKPLMMVIKAVQIYYEVQSGAFFYKLALKKLSEKFGDKLKLLGKVVKAYNAFEAVKSGDIGAFVKETAKDEAMRYVKKKYGDKLGPLVAVFDAFKGVESGKFDSKDIISKTIKGTVANVLSKKLGGEADRFVEYYDKLEGIKDRDDFQKILAENLKNELKIQVNNKHGDKYNRLFDYYDNYEKIKKDDDVKEFIKETIEAEAIHQIKEKVGPKADKFVEYYKDLKEIKTSDEIKEFGEKVLKKEVVDQLKQKIGDKADKMVEIYDELRKVENNDQLIKLAEEKANEFILEKTKANLGPQADGIVDHFTELQKLNTTDQYIELVKRNMKETALGHLEETFGVTKEEANKLYDKVNGAKKKIAVASKVRKQVEQESLKKLKAVHGTAGYKEFEGVYSTFKKLTKSKEIKDLAKQDILREAKRLSAKEKKIRKGDSKLTSPKSLKNTEVSNEKLLSDLRYVLQNDTESTSAAADSPSVTH